MNQLHGVGRWLIFLGLGLALLGALLLMLPKISWFGRLPGDVLVQRPNLTVFFPFTTCLLLSVIVSLVLWIMGRLFR